jgi:hypothetical protein
MTEEKYSLLADSREGSQSPTVFNSFFASPNVDAGEPPAPMQGWIKKQSRRGLIKNWQIRYMTISCGLLKYFEGYDATSDLPQICKGTLALTEATLDRSLTNNSKQVYITGRDGEYGMIVCSIKLSICIIY